MSQGSSTKSNTYLELRFAAFAMLCAIFCGWALLRQEPSGPLTNRSPANISPQMIEPEVKPAPVAAKNVRVLSLDCRQELDGFSISTTAALVRFELLHCNNGNLSQEMFGFNRKDDSKITIMKHTKSGRQISSFFPIDLGKNELVLRSIRGQKSKEKIVTIIRN